METNMLCFTEDVLEQHFINIYLLLELTSF